MMQNVNSFFFFLDRGTLSQILNTCAGSQFLIVEA
jgi:hypothetical protein